MLNLLYPESAEVRSHNLSGLFFGGGGGGGGGGCFLAGEGCWEKVGPFLTRLRCFFFFF